MGPYNGDLVFLTSDVFGSGCADGSNDPADRLCEKHPNFINFDAVGTSVDGRQISMRIDNVTVYEPANPAVNFFNGDPYQINLRPIYDREAGIYPENDTDHQTFTPESVLSTLADTEPRLPPAAIASISHPQRCADPHAVQLACREL
jgi:hypothetical protein